MVRAYVHQSGDGFLRIRNSLLLEIFPDLIEQHNGNGFRIFADYKRSYRRYRHQKIFVKNLTAENVPHGADDDIRTKQHISCKIYNIRYQFADIRQIIQHKTGSQQPEACKNSYQPKVFFGFCVAMIVIMSMIMTMTMVMPAPSTVVMFF
jgi:hypothetical protein